MKLGFIGCGNMAQAMITGILTQKVVSPNELIVSNPREEKMAQLKEKFGILTTTENQKVARESDILVLAVKPQVYQTVIKEIKEEVTTQQIIVTIAAGVSMATTERQFGKETKIVRVMPNTPALVGEWTGGASFSIMRAGSRPLTTVGWIQRCYLQFSCAPQIYPYVRCNETGGELDINKLY